MSTKRSKTRKENARKAVRRSLKKQNSEESLSSVPNLSDFKYSESAKTKKASKSRQSSDNNNSLGNVPSLSGFNYTGPSVVEPKPWSSPQWSSWSFEAKVRDVLNYFLYEVVGKPSHNRTFNPEEAVRILLHDDSIKETENIMAGAQVSDSDKSKEIRSENLYKHFATKQVEMFEKQIQNERDAEESRRDFAEARRAPDISISRRVCKSPCRVTTKEKRCHCITEPYRTRFGIKYSWDLCDEKHCGNRQYGFLVHGSQKPIKDKITASGKKRRTQKKKRIQKKKRSSRSTKKR